MNSSMRRIVRAVLALIGGYFLVGLPFIVFTTNVPTWSGGVALLGGLVAAAWSWRRTAPQTSGPAT